jgi:hypothetical protein
LIQPSNNEPLGLVRWRGAYALLSGGVSKFGAGYGFVEGSFTLISDCLNGQRAFASIKVTGSGFGAGVSMLAPLSVSSSKATFEDQLSDPNPDVFNGRFDMLSAGTFFWSKYSEFRLGGAVGTGRGLGISTEILGAYGASGVSHVVHKRFECCSQ